MADPSCPSCHPPATRRWYASRVLWSAAIVGAVLLAGALWPMARPASEALWGYLARGGGAVAIGLLLGGVIDHAVPKEYITVWLAGCRRRTILTAAGLGVLASSCSHGCLALAVELFHKGASVPAVITFLLASPWASLSLTLLLLSLMGTAGLVVVIGAWIIALTTGFIFQWLDRRGALDRNPHQVTVAADFSIRRDLAARWRARHWTTPAVIDDLRGIARGAWKLAEMVLLWVAIGFTASAVLGAVVPHGWWMDWMGPTAVGLLVTMVVAAVIEVCSEGTAPLAVEIYRHTGALGNAFGFLMGGVVTDWTELSLLWATIGRRTVGWLLIVTLPQVFVLSYLLNQIRR